MVDRGFLETKFEVYYKEHPDSFGTPGELILSTIGKTPRAFERTCWFHLTRTLPTNKFDGGILPLNKVIDRIWNDLFVLVENDLSFEEWSAFKHWMETTCNNQFAHLYQLNVNNPEFWGPFAMLVREVAFHPSEVSNHDYLRAPEIVERISTCFYERYGREIDLQKRFQRETSPCVVKFIRDGGDQASIKTALHYLYNTFWGVKVITDWNETFDAKGEIIDRKDVLKIDFPKYQSSPAGGH